MKEIFRLTIDLVPPSLNDMYSGQHWTKRKKSKDTWRRYLAAIQKDIPKFKKFPIAVEAVVYRKDNRRRDPDNAVVAVKLFNDSLVAMGKIPDDSSKYIKWIKCSIVGGAQKDYTDIIIYEVENEFKLT